MKFEILTEAVYKKLRSNSIASENSNGKMIDHNVVVKIFTPDANATWYLTEIQEDGLAFGIADLGNCDHPGYGYFHINDLRNIRGRLGLKVEVDRYFKGKNLSSYLKV